MNADRINELAAEAKRLARECSHKHATPANWHTLDATIDALRDEPPEPSVAAVPIATVRRGGSDTFGRATVLVRWEGGAEALPDGEHKLYAASPAPAAPDVVKPLSEEQIEDCIDEANRLFNCRRQGPCGQQLTAYDDWKHWLVRAVERAHGIAASGVKGPQQPVMGDPAVPPVEAPAARSADKGSLPASGAATSGATDL